MTHDEELEHLPGIMPERVRRRRWREQLRVRAEGVGGALIVGGIVYIVIMTITGKL